jgi:hypothetical protein
MRLLFLSAFVLSCFGSLRKVFDQFRKMAGNRSTLCQIIMFSQPLAQYLSDFAGARNFLSCDLFQYHRRPRLLARYPNHRYSQHAASLIVPETLRPALHDRSVRMRNVPYREHPASWRLVDRQSVRP